MIKTKKAIFLLLIFLSGALIYCEKKSVLPEFVQPEPPKMLSLVPHGNDIFAHWQPSESEDIMGYLLFIGQRKNSYADTIRISHLTNTVKLSTKQPNAAYFCRVAAINGNKLTSDLSAEASISSYQKLETFSQENSKLDSSRWFFTSDFENKILDSTVVTTEKELYKAPISRCFAQYLAEKPLDNFVVECEFQLGNPNIGGAGIMIRSEKAISLVYYKGYFAYFLWNGKNWFLNSEEGSLARFALQNEKPLKLPTIDQNEWV